MGLSINDDDYSDDSPVRTTLPKKKSFSVESILKPDFRPNQQIYSTVSFNYFDNCLQNDIIFLK